MQDQYLSCCEATNKILVLRFAKKHHTMDDNKLHVTMDDNKLHATSMELSSLPDNGDNDSSIEDVTEQVLEERTRSAAIQRETIDIIDDGESEDGEVSGDDYDNVSGDDYDNNYYDYDDYDVYDENVKTHQSFHDLHQSYDDKILEAEMHDDWFMEDYENVRTQTYEDAILEAKMYEDSFLE
jgi:hypothetical protein